MAQSSPFVEELHRPPHGQEQFDLLTLQRTRTLTQVLASAPETGSRAVIW